MISNYKNLCNETYNNEMHFISSKKINKLGVLRFPDIKKLLLKLLLLEKETKVYLNYIQHPRHHQHSFEKDAIYTSYLTTNFLKMFRPAEIVIIYPHVRRIL